MGIIQEKFDYELPEPPAAETEWATPQSARRSVKAEGLRLPPGSNMADQGNPPSNTFGYSCSGNMARGKNAGDVSQDLNTKSARKGYDFKPMSTVEDQYSREHNDAFYDEIKVDGITGFVERNNVLDRE